MDLLETDYLVIGAGATGLAFADTLLQQGDAHITLVDLHAKPGGHWNDAYPFVALHQPSAFYGVNSLALGSGRKDTVGHNAGLYELASGAEVSGYFHKVMQQQLLPSGRVHHLPMTRFLGMADGAGRIASLLSGAESQIRVRRKVVDARWFSPNVPATTRPKFSVAPGVRWVTPTGLTQLWQAGQERPGQLCILGAGKTAMDVGVWLLNCGVLPDAIRWVMPRDSWLVNRLTTQPGEEFFRYSIGGQVQQMKAMAEASDPVDLFERLEASGQMLRIDRTQRPRMFHYATMSEGEVQLLRQITQVIRKGRVQAIETGALVLDQGRETMDADTLYIDCTASAVEVREMAPMFQPGRILPQLVRAPLVSFSAAVCAYVEANFDDDAVKNRLCTPVPFPRSVAGY
ncbi:MAG: NAD(P)/FAD-dependent oxidoreductase, partial [Betaproteobacteria bacterium]|nr:NAD(P)/FAD-dependent oxidoreductase [Betaproteobacteria bacterium]